MQICCTVKFFLYLQMVRMWDMQSALSAVRVMTEDSLTAAVMRTLTAGMQHREPRATVGRDKSTSVNE